MSEWVEISKGGVGIVVVIGFWFKERINEERRRGL
jgi:hypothetical protein